MAENAGSGPAGGANSNPAGGDPAGNANANPAGGDSAGGGLPPVWTEALTPELKGFAETKGWKDPGEVVSGYQNLEKLTGVPAEQLLRLPKEGDADALGKVYDKLGRPATAEEYKLPVPEGQDDTFSKTAAGWFHKVGLSGVQATKLTETWNEYQAELEQKISDEYQAKVVVDKAALAKEWGTAHEKNIQIARAAAQSFEIKADTLDQLEKVMGFAGLMRFMHGLGSQLGEDNFLSGDGLKGFGGVMSPAAAQAQITDLRNDIGFIKKYTAGDAEAKAKMERLHKAAYPES